MTLSVAQVYPLVGGLLVGLALVGLRQGPSLRRWAAAAFWAGLGALYLLGDALPKAGVGAGVLGLALLAGVSPPERSLDAAAAPTPTPTGNLVLIPALLLSLVPLATALLLSRVSLGGVPLVAAAHTAPVGLALGGLASLAVGLWLFRPGLATASGAARRLLDSIGSVALLPLLLSMLGQVLSKSGGGQALAGWAQASLPVGTRLGALLFYGLGMAGLAALSGNAFAAFPVMTAGFGLPILVGQHGADPASLAAIGMLTGYCGTLLSPMAANFNLVPVALLGLRDRGGVIAAQRATAVPLFLANLVLMYFVVFRHAHP